MDNQTQWAAIDETFRRAMACRACFDDGLAEAALIDIAVPRWIGPTYFTARPRVLIVALNPGAGNSPEKRKTNAAFLPLLQKYRDGRETREVFFAAQKVSMRQWGTPPGRFSKFYFDRVQGMGVDLDSAALANVAWCAAKSNKWSTPMLDRCFKQHTSRLISILSPDVAILSGSGTHRYESSIKRLLPKCKVVCTLHYAHREGQDAERTDLERVRGELASLGNPQFNRTPVPPAGA